LAVEKGPISELSEGGKWAQEPNVMEFLVFFQILG
jgi:hypothetical protein